MASLVIQETATVLSYRLGQSLALDFVDRAKKMPFTKIVIDETLERLAWQAFKASSKKGTSFIDCANVAIYKHFKMDAIFSFDGFYRRGKVAILS